MTTWVAFVAVAVRIEDPPDETEVGLAPSVTVGGLTAPPTVTVAVAVALASRDVAATGSEDSCSHVTEVVDHVVALLHGDPTPLLLDSGAKC